MQTNPIVAATGFRLAVVPADAPVAPTGQHRYLPTAQPVPASPIKLSKSLLVSAIKTTVAELVNHDEPPKIKNSLHLSQQLGQDYAYLARVFSEATGSTIERYIIAQKIDRVKVLLLTEELSLSQIAYRLNYSNIGHLCNQFKKVTGVTPSFFKQLMQQRDISLGYLDQNVKNDVTTFCNPVIISLIQYPNFVR